MKTNQSTTRVWRELGRRAVLGFLGMAAFGAVMVAAPRAAEALTPCNVTADCANAPEGPVCLNTTKTCGCTGGDPNADPKEGFGTEFQHDECKNVPGRSICLLTVAGDMEGECSAVTCLVNSHQECNMKTSNQYAYCSNDGLCKPDVKNGEEYPGTCNPASTEKASVCVNSVCDNDNKNICGIAKGSKVECTEDTYCYKSVCENASGFTKHKSCVECYEDDHCKDPDLNPDPNLTACDSIDKPGASFECVECTGKSHCVGNADGPICNQITKECQENCKDHSDCDPEAWCDNDSPNTYSGTCKPDKNNKEEIPTYLPCNDTTAEAVCISKVCEPASGNDPAQCVECTVANTQNCPTEACVDSTNTCETCTTANVTKCPADKKKCQEATEPNECVQCLDDSDCPADKPTCNAAGTCSPQCKVDADCPGQWCDLGFKGGTCQDKLENGKPMPESPNHNPTLDGKCTPEAAKAVCKTGACDPEANICGILIDHKTCTQDAQCIDSVCEEATKECEECTVNADCKDSAKPYCGTVSRKCGECETNADCTDPSKPACDTASATCKPTCKVDTDCEKVEWCDLSKGVDQGVCTSDVPNGKRVPTSPNHNPNLNGTCTPEVGAAVCLSTVCYTKDNLCGYPTGPACENSVQCRTNICSADKGICICTEDAQCPSGRCDIPSGRCDGDPDLNTGYIAGAGLCTGSSSSSVSGTSLIPVGGLVLLAAFAGRLARRREKRKHG